MKTNMLRGASILGLGVLLFGVITTAPAFADGWHRDRDRDWDRDRDRDHGRVVLDVRLDRGHVNTDFVFWSGPDHRPAGKFWYWDKHDRCWRRDRCR